MSMQSAWQRYRSWFSTLAPRERLIVAVAVVGGIGFLGYSYAIEPAMLRTREAQRQLQTLPAETQALRAQAELMAAQARDPDVALRAELARAEADYTSQAQRFRAVERSLIPPREMATLLDSLLKRGRGLELVSLRSLAPVPILADADKAGADGNKAATAKSPAEKSPDAGVGNLYRHGIELRVAGNYLDLLAYLEHLESQAPNLIWGRLELKTERYPRSVMTLTVHTLSMELPWLAL